MKTIENAVSLFSVMMVIVKYFSSLLAFQINPETESIVAFADLRRLDAEGLCFFIRYSTTR